jgi:hypothetical protein
MAQLGSDYLDIRGVLTRDQAVVSSKGYLVVPSSQRQLNFLLRETDVVRANMEAAHHYAKLVIKEHLGAPRLIFAN